MFKEELRIALPKDVKWIIDKLTEHGYEAYAVGGCVRDSILHKEPKDWDITTSARPNQVKALFERTIDTGIQHGTVTVMIGKNGYEVTTYRIDGEYEDGRHPKTVEFSENLVEDLKRRDFTINAMAYNDVSGLVDEFDGIGDIKRQVIRCVRDAKERFTEDALRMMRAVRFSAQLGFGIEENTFAAVCELAPNIKKVSRERIQVEFTKTLLSGHPDFVIKFEDGGILTHVLPKVHEVMQSGDCKKVLNMLGMVENNASARYAALLFLVGRQQAIEELRGLRLDNHTISQCCKFIKSMEEKLVESESELRHFLCEYDGDFWPAYSDYIKTYYSAFAKTPGELQLELAKIENANRMYKVIMERGDCVSMKQMCIGGNDLIASGMKSGSGMGKILKSLLSEVLDEPAHNNREWLLERARVLCEAENDSM